MKKTQKIILIYSLIVIINIIFLPSVFAQSVKAENIAGDLDGKILCLKQNMEDKFLYAGTDEGLYVRKISGAWTKTGYFQGNVEIYDIGSDDGKLLIVTDSGIYKEKEQGLAQLITRQKDIRGILTVNTDLAEDDIYVWSFKNIFKLKNGYTEDITPEYLKGDIKNIIESKGTIFAVTDKRVYILKEDSRIWKEVFLIKSVGKEEFEEEQEVLDEEQDHVANIRGVEKFVIGKKDILYSDTHSEDNVAGREGMEINRYDYANGGCLVCTSKGIFVLDKNGVIYKRISITGFPANNIVCAVQTKDGIVAATDSKIYVYDILEGTWKTYFENNYLEVINFLKVYEGNGGDGEEILYAVIGNSIIEMEIEYDVFRLQGDTEEDVFIEQQRAMSSIREVQTMAVVYAEVSPEKIKAWRTSAKWKAILPKLSLSYAESIDANVEIYKSASNHYVVSGPREIDNDWSVDLSWDLSGLIWSSSQTSIDVRSKLMVQLRNEILEDLTRLYFERQRVLEELIVLSRRAKQENLSESNRSGISEKVLRILELNSYLDALTGGEFSKALEN